MKARCMVVGDEPLAIEAIQMHVEKFDSLKLVATCTDAIQAFYQLRNARIDLLFHDIQMPEMTGLDFLKSLVSDFDKINVLSLTWRMVYC